MIKMRPVTICDKCGEEVNPEVSFDSMDFCKECYAKLFDLIQGWLIPCFEPAKEEPIEIEIPEFMEKKLDEVAEHKTMSEIKETPNKSGSKKKVKTSTCTRKNARGIDWDKACALKLAGRTNAWIADELGIKLSTVNVEIYKKLKEYKARKDEEAAEAKRRILEC